MNPIYDLAGDGSLYGDPSAVIAIHQFGQNACCIVLATGGEPFSYKVHRPVAEVAEHIAGILIEMFTDDVYEDGEDADGYE